MSEKTYNFDFAPTPIKENVFGILSNIIFLISTFILIGPKENYIKLLSDELYSKSLIFISTTILGFIF